MAIEIDVIVDHPEFGIGKIDEIDYDTGDPRVSVIWNDGRRGMYWIDELEFIPVNRD